MNDAEAQRIAAAINIARPDWPMSSLLSFVRNNLMTRPRRDVFVALAWVASESETQTPARVLESGPWWRAAGIEGATGAAKRGPICLHCGFEEHECSRRFATDHEFEGPDDWMRRRPSPEQVAKTLEYIRSGIGDAKAERVVDEPEPLPPLPEVDRLRELAKPAACEHPVGPNPCGHPAPHLSADRRRPLCDEHAHHERTSA